MALFLLEYDTEICKYLMRMTMFFVFVYLLIFLFSYFLFLFSLYFFFQTKRRVVYLKDTDISGVEVSIS
jgi:hypothetical protein